MRPSRAIILTGRYSWQLEEVINHQNIFPSKFGSYVEVLAANGYMTGYTGKDGAQVLQMMPLVRGEISLARCGLPKTKTTRTGHFNNDYSGNFADFLAATPEGKPWCFWFGTSEPHRGYEKGVGLRMGKN